MFICDIEVIYGNQESEAPSDRVTELNNKSDNINDKFGGSYVWLVPKRSATREDGITSVGISIQKTVDDNKKDLAKGAGGDYRYLILSRDTAKAVKITGLALYRCKLEENLTKAPEGWEKFTGDINDGREDNLKKTTLLYLLWKTT